MAESTLLHIPIAGWSAWSSHLQTPADWAAWDGNPAALAPGDNPDVKFLPAMFRRRISRVSRIALRVAYDCVGPDGVGGCRTVFASRYGEQEISLELLTAVVTGMPLSPTQFSVSVHNAASGLFSIAHRNQHPATAIAAMGNTFAMGFLEAAAQRHRHPETPVLLVMTDEPMPEIYSDYTHGQPALYGLALLLHDSPDAVPLGVSLDPADARVAESEDLPPTPAFIRWFLDSRQGTRFQDASGLTWTRSPAGPPS